VRRGEEATGQEEGRRRKDEEEEGREGKKEETQGWTEIGVKDGAGQTHRVNVMTAPYLRSKLVIELTPKNMELLTILPYHRTPVVSTFTPFINESNVSWLSYRSALRIHYHNKEADKWVTKTMKINQGTPEEMQNSVNRCSKLLQAFYNENHTEPHPMDMPPDEHDSD